MAPRQSATHPGSIRNAAPPNKAAPKKGQRLGRAKNRAAPTVGLAAKRMAIGVTTKDALRSGDHCTASKAARTGMLKKPKSGPYPNSISAHAKATPAIAEKSTVAVCAGNGARGSAITAAGNGYTRGNGQSNAIPGPICEYGYAPPRRARAANQTCSKSRGVGSLEFFCSVIIAASR